MPRDLLPADGQRRPARPDHALLRGVRATAPASRRTCRCSGSARPGPLAATTCSTQDVIYVGGGSMRNMLAIWRVHELDAILREAWERGIVLAGPERGRDVLVRGRRSRSRAGRRSPSPGLGLLPGSLSRALPTASPSACPRTSPRSRRGALPRRLRRRRRRRPAVPRRRGSSASSSSRPGAGCVRVRRAGDRASRAAGSTSTCWPTARHWWRSTPTSASSEPMSRFRATRGGG